MEEKIEIPELPSNSLVPKDEEKRVIKAKRIEKKKNFGNSLLVENMRGVSSYVLFEVLIPAAKNTISDMISNGIEMLLYGEPRSTSRGKDRDRGKSSFVSYTSFYDRDRDRGRERTRKSRFHLDDILLDTREDADEVLQSMFDILDEYNAVTVSEFLELVGLPDEYTDQNYGWTNLRNAEARRVRDGYILDLPDPRALPR